LENGEYMIFQIKTIIFYLEFNDEYAIIFVTIFVAVAKEIDYEKSGQV
jgi:hypothetical protein